MRSSQLTYRRYGWTVSGAPEAVHVHAASALELVLGVNLEPRLLVHVDAMGRRAGEEEREIERVTVVRGNDGGLSLADVLEEAPNRRGLQETSARSA